jgi:hypothetical protein
MVVVQDDPVELRLLDTRLLLDAGILLEDAGRIARNGHVTNLLPL